MAMGTYGRTPRMKMAISSIESVAHLYTVHRRFRQITPLDLTYHELSGEPTDGDLGSRVNRLCFANFVDKESWLNPQQSLNKTGSLCVVASLNHYNKLGDDGSHPLMENGREDLLWSSRIGGGVWLCWSHNQ